jgi:hypothetical protein
VSLASVRLWIPSLTPKKKKKRESERGEKNEGEGEENVYNDNVQNFITELSFQS